MKTSPVLPKMVSTRPATGAPPRLRVRAGPLKAAGSIGSLYMIRTTLSSATPLLPAAGSIDCRAGGVRSRVLKLARNGFAIGRSRLSVMPDTFTV